MPVRKSGSTKTRAARLVSTLFHPALMMVAATAAAATGAGASPMLLWQALATVAVAAAAVLLYSAWRTRSGSWSHIDASQTHERAQLNRFAAWLLCGLAAVLAVAGAHPGLVAGIALSGAIVLAGHLLRRWLKSSLHVAFAAFAACIAWPHAAVCSVLAVATLAVAWSRLVLGRHAAGEVVSGAVLGLVAGAALQVIARG